MENKQKQIIDLLIENEKAMQNLYKVYARKLPLFEKFWTEIAQEEESHAAWISTLNGKMDAGIVTFAESRFPLDAVKKNTEYLKDKSQIAAGKEVLLGEALETAVHAERGMLENKFFEVFKSDSLELQIVLEALRLGTEAHLRRIENLWQKEKFGSEAEKLRV